MVEPGVMLEHPGGDPTGAERDVAPAAEWFSAFEAARRIGVNERTIRRAIARRELPATKTAGVYNISSAALANFHRTLLKKVEPEHVAPQKPRLISLGSAR